MTADLDIQSGRDFAIWLDMASPGDRCCYWIGQLSSDSNDVSCRCHLLAATARQAAERGEVFLLQGRHGRNDFAYLAVKASPEARYLARTDPPHK